jgi:hypothetical protein
MMLNTKLLAKDPQGSTVVELAIILPLLVLLLFGIIEFSLLIYNQQIITNAAREGARFGIIVKSPRVENSEIKNEIINYAQKYLVTFGPNIWDDDYIEIAKSDDKDDGNGACICSNPDAEANQERCLTFGCDLKIVVTYNYNFLVLSNLGFNQKILKAVSVMRME